MNPIKTLHLTLHKKWFDEIIEGSKTIEYREVKQYWEKRLLDTEGKPKQFDEIFFRNGYSKNARWMKVEFLGVKKGKEKYEISLGKVLESNS